MDHRQPVQSAAGPITLGAPSRRPEPCRLPLDEVEAVARIGSYAMDIAAGSWVSSPGLDGLFGIDSRFERTVEGWASLIHPDDRAAMVTYLTDEVVGRAQPFDRQYRIVRPDSGEERWLHGLGRLECDTAGHPLRMIGTITDITAQHRAQEALIASELRYATIFEGTLEAILIAERATKRFRWVNAAACDLLGYSRDELLSLTVADIHPPDVLAEILADFEEKAGGGGVTRLVPCLRKDGTQRLVDIRSSSAEIDGVPCLVGFFADVTDLHRLEARDRQLAQAVEQTSDSVVITDAAGTIEYANPAFAQISGYRRDEVIGRNPRILKSGRQSDAFYRAFWRRLTRGKAWRGTLVNRRQDGTLYEVQATISPLLGDDGEITGYVGVERDVTAVRAAESALSAEFRERAQAAAALGRLQPSPTPEATAAEICDELLALPGFDVATIFDFAGPTRATALANGGPPGMPVSVGRPLPEARARYLYERAALGPWAEAWRARPEDGQYGQTMADLGLQAVAYAPIRNGDGLLGLVAAGTRDAAFGQHLIEHLPIVGEFAATASALLSRRLERAHRADLARARIEHILTEHAFHPVLQPIVSLASSKTVGYEALTRFDDNAPPDQRIAEAHAVGLGDDLELACLAAALEAAADLPAGLWLSLNLSPGVLAHATRLPRVLAGHPRPLVLELTEHVAIDDYRTIRRRLDRLGPQVRLAVDDAGAGFASLRHVVELRPDFLKLDISLVRDVDRDLTREAMVAGLVRFAERAQCAVIAEGIERRAEADTLRELGVPYGQGFLLGRPEPPMTAANLGRSDPGGA